MNNVACVIFDLDGTLIDSSQGVTEATNYALAQVGLPPKTVDEVSPYIGYPLEDMFRDFTDIPYEEMHRHFQARAAETVVLSAQQLPGVNEVLEKLARCGCRMAIATTKIKRHVDGIVDKMGWREYFEVTTAGDEVERVKPFPDAFQLTLRRMEALAENSVVVGDTVNDIQAAKLVPVRCIGVVSPYGKAERLVNARPDVLLSNIAELPEVIGC